MLELRVDTWAGFFWRERHRTNKAVANAIFSIKSRARFSDVFRWRVTDLETGEVLTDWVNPKVPIL